MENEKNKSEMLNMLNVMLDETNDYAHRLTAYEYLLEDCGEIVDEMIEKLYLTEGETGKMLMEVLAEYKGNKAVYMNLVSYLYKGEDIALFARLLGSYGDERAIEVLKSFAQEYELNYNEFMEVRNAVEQLGGYFDIQENFEDDPFYRLIKGLDETDDQSRKSPFEDYFNPTHSDSDDSDEECECHNHPQFHSCGGDNACEH